MSTHMEDNQTRLTYAYAGQNDDMNINTAVRKACEQPSLVDALSWIAVWESELAIQQARRFFETGVPTGSHGGWDTCFKLCFQLVLEKYGTTGADV
jgi:hypothetical protein